MNALGARTTVCARKLSDLAMAESLGNSSLPISSLEEGVGEYDIIFNTIPAMVLGNGLLKKVKSDSLIIDLASKPGGADFYLDKVFYYRKKVYHKRYTFIYIYESIHLSKRPR